MDVARGVGAGVVVAVVAVDFRVLELLTRPAVDINN